MIACSVIHKLGMNVPPKTILNNDRTKEMEFYMFEWDYRQFIYLNGNRSLKGLSKGFYWKNTSIMKHYIF